MEFTPSLVIALFIALTVPVLFLFILRKFDLHRTAKFGRNILTLAFGIGGFFLAVQVNEGVQRLGWVTYDQVVRFTAPFAEEILKSLILLYLVSRADFNYVVDGALYGFGAGIGFAVIENIQYVTDDRFVNSALLVAILRVFSTNLMHATGSGLIGTALAYHRGEKVKSRSIWIVLGGYLIAIAFHLVFNNMVSSGVLIFIAIAYGVVGAVLIWYIIRRGMSTQREWVSQLGAEDRVSQQETRAVTSIDKVVDMLIKPFQEKFGDEKVPLVRGMLYTQIEIGIKRKLVESTPSPTKKRELEDIIKKLGTDMEALRRQIGTYHMMFVRTVYLDQSFQVWAKIDARIAESSTGQKGGGLFDRATERIKEKSVKKDEA